MELLFIVIIAQSRFGFLYRSNAAEQIGIHLRAVLQLHIILCLKGDIVGIVGDEDQIIFLQRNAGNHLVIKTLQDIRILQLGFPQLHQKSMLFTVQHLLVAEGDIHQIFAQCTGQGFFQQI